MQISRVAKVLMLKVLMVVGKKVMMWQRCCEMAGDIALFGDMADDMF